MTTPLPFKAPPGKTIPALVDWSDSRLVAGLLAGDRRAAAAMYDTLRPAIDRALRRILHNQGPDFEDHVQVTFERILRSLAEGRFEQRSSLRTWAAAIASHVALDALRRQERNRPRTLELPEQDMLPSVTRTEPRLESMSELARVQSILSNMKPDLAETLILHDVLGYQLDEISEMRAASPSATQSRLHRARKELRRRAEATISRGVS